MDKQYTKKGKSKQKNPKAPWIIWILLTLFHHQVKEIRVIIFILYIWYFNSLFYLLYIGEVPWIPDPSDPFNEPEWVTKQRLDWLARKKRKEKFKQETVDVARADAIRRSSAHQKRIANKQK